MGGHRWQPGESGNPKGRPRKQRALSALLRTVGGTHTEEGLLKRRALAEKVWELALKGDLDAAKIIYEYCDGKPVQRQEVTGAGGGPIETKQVFDYDAYAKLFGAMEEPDDKGTA